MPIRIALYEDNHDLRNSLAYLLRLHPDFEVALAQPSPVALLDDLQTARPDVLLMDIDMPQMTGIEAVRLLRAEGFDTPVVMLTVFDDDEHIYKAICAGANGYLLKHDFEQVAPAIRNVLNGGAPLTGSVARKVLQAFSGQKPVAQPALLPENLTDREKEILEELVQGYSYKMIADRLSLSMDTIRTHIRKIYRKLQVNSATEAVYKTRQYKP